MTVNVWSSSVVYGTAPSPARAKLNKNRLSTSSLRNIAGKEAVGVVLFADAMKKKRRRSASLIKFAKSVQLTKCYYIPIVSLILNDISIWTGAISQYFLKSVHLLCYMLSHFKSTFSTSLARKSL